MRVHPSMACWPGLFHHQVPDFLDEVRDTATEPFFGSLSFDHIQLVPQSFGRLDEAVIDSLQARHPTTRFRLHANVRVLPEHRFADLAVLSSHADWFSQAARLCRLLNAPAYSLHPGKRVDATLSQVLDNARRCEDLFGCPVAVEGMYPAQRHDYLLSTWDEYRALLESPAAFAIDLSHVQILVARTRCLELQLLREMLGCDRCLEVHVSDNDGTSDQHRVCHRETWWWPLLPEIHPAAVVFTEGNHRTASLQRRT